MSCFYVYVLPLLRTSLGFESPHLPKNKAATTSDIKNIHGKTLFLKGTVENGKATLLGGQASSMLKSFAIFYRRLNSSHLDRFYSNSDHDYFGYYSHDYK